MGHLPHSADTIQPEVATTEDHPAIQLDTPDVCPPPGEDLSASDVLGRWRLITFPRHKRREERPAVPGKYASDSVFTASTRPHAQLPSLKGTPQNWPGRRCTFDLGSNGYFGMGLPHRCGVPKLCHAI